DHRGAGLPGHRTVPEPRRPIRIGQVRHRHLPVALHANGADRSRHADRGYDQPAGRRAGQGLEVWPARLRAIEPELAEHEHEPDHGNNDHADALLEVAHDLATTERLRTDHAAV